MWDGLESSHLLNSSGTRYYYLRSLMGLPTPGDDGIHDHLLLINNIGSSLKKICIDGKISIEDVKITALISSLPSSSTSVTSHFERQTTVSYKAVSDAVRSTVVNNKDRTVKTTGSSTANSVKATSKSSSLTSRPNNSNQQGRNVTRHNGAITLKV